MRGRKLRLTMAVLTAALAVSLAVSLAVMTAGCGGDDEGTGDGGASGEPIKIGAIVSLTGTYAGLGEPEKNVIEMEVERINDAGGVNGRPIEVIIEDDATDDAKAVAAASKLIEQDEVVALIAATGTGATMAVRGDVQRAGMPQVSMAGGTVIAQPVDPLVFQTPWSNTIVVPFTLNYLKAQGITKIGLISDTGGFGADGKAVVEQMAPDAGVTIVSNQTFNAGDADMTAQLTKIKNSDAEAIVMWTAGAEAATIAKNVKDLAHRPAVLRQPRHRPPRVHRRRRRRGRGRQVRRRQGPHPRGLRRGHRGVHRRHRLHRPLHRGLRRRAEHLRGARLRCAVHHRRGDAAHRRRHHP